MADPIAPHSAPISAYMSVHEATNLAYVRYFGKIDNATKAKFKSINSKNFTLDYELPNDSKVYQLTIPFKTPLKKREEIRPILEEMAKEAETALGLPSSLSGPPPLKAIAKALIASTTDVYTPSQPHVPLNSFYLPDTNSMLMIGTFIGLLTLFTYTSDDYLERQFPLQLLQVRTKIGTELLSKCFKGLTVLHLCEGTFTLLTCIGRGWYSPLNTLKWTLSSIFFGVGSLKQLKKHAEDVAGLKK
ncbi:uncharacterized protein BX663DRAFT_95834 [Cokeromyces recurvatus]|uniref:uncharacterized protein n=1 Tax=Cokeromyces recurvatus TaxID=90255 RepID=UPI00221F36A3|nr:uncharacterized protein BX663DRAFT_95834 [Cokeromyces recurvatus]KAI7901987.1 hypothetical protein BX663DRAFT_95834 [Cokeromyces recurvatus]